MKVSGKMATAKIKQSLQKIKDRADEGIENYDRTKESKKDLHGFCMEIKEEINKIIKGIAL